jgi:hypothetical protein
MKKEKIVLWVIFILFVILCSCPIFVNLGDLAARKWDESRNGINAMEMLYNHNYIVTSFDNAPDMWNSKPPFFIWMVVLSMKFLGTTVFALRLPSALSCLGIAIYSFWFFKGRFNSIVAGFASGLVLVTSVGFIDYHVSRNGDFDAMLSMWIFFYTTQFFLYFEFKERKNLILASLFLALAILTKGIAGCLFLPGIFVFLFFKKNYLTLFKTKTIYIIPLMGILFGASYYFLREHYNPGYIKAVIENEITGRYVNANEGHTGGITYYIDLLTDVHYKFWIYCIPIALVFVFVRAEKKLKWLCLFLFFQALSYLIVITFSHTKLPWYDAPFFGFFAAIIALGINQLYLELKNMTIIHNLYIKLFLFFVLSCLIFKTPVRNIFSTSIMGEKETYYPEQFYGDFTASVLNVFPKQKKLNIVSLDYNPHLLFYTYILKHNGKEVNIIPPVNKFVENDTFLVCEPIMYPKPDSTIAYDTLYQEDNIKYFIRIISKAEYQRNKSERLFQSKIAEIKGNSEWSAAIKKKAEEQKVTYEKQVMRDALWTLKEEKKITQEENDSMVLKYGLGN